jgi:hypothetical protein
VRFAEGAGETLLTLSRRYAGKSVKSGASFEQRKLAILVELDVR